MDCYTRCSKVCGDACAKQRSRHKRRVFTSSFSAGGSMERKPGYWSL